MGKGISLYVTSRFNDKKAVKAVQDKAITRGWTITEGWTLNNKVDLSAEHYEIAEMRADDDIEGIRKADVFIMLHSKEAVDGTGNWVELGAAIAFNIASAKPGVPFIYIVSEEKIDSCIFAYHPLVSRRAFVEQVFDEVEILLAEEPI